jgi:hypothetical protein
MPTIQSPLERRLTPTIKKKQTDSIVKRSRPRTQGFVSGAPTSTFNAKHCTPPLIATVAIAPPQKQRPQRGGELEPKLRSAGRDSGTILMWFRNPA